MITIGVSGTSDGRTVGPPFRYHDLGPTAYTSCGRLATSAGGCIRPVHGRAGVALLGA
jgi:hypothetical protein